MPPLPPQTKAGPQPWWFAAFGAIGLGAYVAIPELPFSRWGRLLARTALVAGSAASAAALGPAAQSPLETLGPQLPLSRRVGAGVVLAASLLTSPLFGDRTIAKLADSLTARGASWPRSRIGAALAAIALLGEGMQRFPPPPKPRTPPPRRTLQRPDPETIMRN